MAQRSSGIRVRKGHAPTTMEVATGAYDVPKATYALMIFVHRSNPIKGLSMEQLDRIFAYGAGRKPVHTWGDLRLKGYWPNERSTFTASARRMIRR
jgi:phosphate transport system substrate-binding protein